MKGNNVKRTKEDYEALKQEAQSMFQSGITQKEICESLVVSVKTIHSWKILGGWKIQSDESIEKNIDTLILFVAEVKVHNEVLYNKLIKTVIQLKQNLKSKNVIK